MFKVLEHKSDAFGSINDDTKCRTFEITIEVYGDGTYRLVDVFDTEANVYVTFDVLPENEQIMIEDQAQYVADQYLFSTKKEA